VREPLGRGSLFTTLEHDYDVRLTYADEEVDATAADPRVAQCLRVPRGAPVMRIRQVIYSSNAKYVIYVIGFYRAERDSLFIRVSARSFLRKNLPAPMRRTHVPHIH